MRPLHTYKCWPRYFAALLDGSKTFEVRKDDRDVKLLPGDVVDFHECSTEGVTSGRVVSFTVGYVLRGDGLVLPKGWMVFALVKP